MKNSAFLAVATALLTACAAGPDYRKPAAELPTAFRETSKDCEGSSPGEEAVAGRFLMNVTVEADHPPPITIVQNRDAALKK